MEKTKDYAARAPAVAPSMAPEDERAALIKEVEYLKQLEVMLALQEEECRLGVLLANATLEDTAIPKKDKIIQPVGRL